MIFGIVYGSYRYNGWRKYKLLEEERKRLDLYPNSESAFAQMVWRYRVDEPGNVIYSNRLFDEMAAQEMQRRLANAGSAQSNRQFVDMIYAIRMNTYHQDWLPHHNPAAQPFAEDQAAQESPA